MSNYLRLYPQPYVPTAPDVVDYRAFRLHQEESIDRVREAFRSAQPGDVVEVAVALPDQLQPAVIFVRPEAWSAVMLHDFDDENR